MKIRIGTRGSKLALWQAHHIQDLLKKQKVDAEIVIIETKGDKIQNVSLSKIGSKGVFTEELEHQLKTKEIDIAVHSAKDVQSKLDDELELIAFTEREVVNDVVVSLDKNFSLSVGNDADLVVGTSSTRRVAFMKYYYPQVKVVDMRGNLQTRFEKMQRGDCHAMILAYAGVHRMNFDDFIVQKLPLETFTPPVGQGSVAIESHRDLDGEKREVIRNCINDPATETCLLAERAFLKTMAGGCSVPTFALCQNIDNNQIFLKGGIISLDGKKMAVQFMTVEAEKAAKAGEILAKKVLSVGGKEILDEILKTVRV